MTGGRCRGQMGQLLAMPEEVLMRIQVSNGTARINCEVPIFVGATSTLRYIGGINLSDFAFSPFQGESGVLVFDRESQRNPLSPTYFRYWWDNEKLEVREG